MITLYLSGAISLGGTITDPAEIRKNVFKAQQLGGELWKLGFYCFIPHLNSFGMEHYLSGTPKENWAKFMTLDLYLIGSRIFNVIFMMQGWDKSLGCRREHALALDVGCVPLYSVEEAKRYLKRRNL